MYKVGDKVVLTEAMNSWEGKIVTVKAITPTGDGIIADIQSNRFTHRDMWLRNEWVAPLTKLYKVLS